MTTKVQKVERVVLGTLENNWWQKCRQWLGLGYIRKHRDSRTHSGSSIYLSSLCGLLLSALWSSVGVLEVWVLQLL